MLIPCTLTNVRVSFSKAFGERIEEMSIPDATLLPGKLFGNGVEWNIGDAREFQFPCGYSNGGIFDCIVVNRQVDRRSPNSAGGLREQEVFQPNSRMV